MRNKLGVEGVCQRPLLNYSDLPVNEIPIRAHGYTALTAGLRPRRKLLSVEEKARSLDRICLLAIHHQMTVRQENTKLAKEVMHQKLRVSECLGSFKLSIQKDVLTDFQVSNTR